MQWDTVPNQLFFFLVVPMEARSNRFFAYACTLLYSMHNFNISSAFGSNDLELQFLSRFNSFANHFVSKSFMTGCVRVGTIS